MRNRERFLRTMRYEAVDHPPLLVGGPWHETRVRWEAEGLPKGVDLYDYFGLEPLRIVNVSPDTIFRISDFGFQSTIRNPQSAIAPPPATPTAGRSGCGKRANPMPSRWWTSVPSTATSTSTWAPVRKPNTQ